MESFWDDSWKHLDEKRLKAYLSRFNDEPDELIEYLKAQNIHTVCDAGCGCGIYSWKLAQNGFLVSGFDVSSNAIQTAKKLFEGTSCTVDLKAASILSTEYKDRQFDAVVCRDVLDHMTKKDAAKAIQELVRITKENGNIIITLDLTDDEYESEPHIISEDNDYIFTGGKWKGMIFHPYSRQEIAEIHPLHVDSEIKFTDENIEIKFTKNE